MGLDLVYVFHYLVGVAREYLLAEAGAKTFRAVKEHKRKYRQKVPWLDVLALEELLL